MKDTVIINGVEYVPKVMTEPEPAKVGRWKPEIGERYWSINSISSPQEWQHNGDQGSFLVHWPMGDVYKTKELATRARDRQLLLVELQDYADQKNIQKQMTDFYYFLVKYDSGWNWASSSGIIPGMVRFWGSADVDAAIAHFGDRLDLLL